MLIDEPTTVGWLGIDAVRRARDAGRGIVRHTPTLSCRSLDELAGAPVFVKAENLQRTGSFKLRGALSRLAGETAPGGVVAGSAGNHAQALAYAARARGISCEVYMPADAAVAKVAAVRAFGETVRLGGASVDDCVAAARERAEQTGAVFVHPFDDPRIIAGQGTLGLELLEDLPEVATVIVPVGGGGLIGGVAGVLKALRPSVRIIGVQAEHCAPFPAARRARPPTARPLSCSPAATSTQACSPRSPTTTRRTRAAGCGCSHACPTGRADWRAWSTRWPRPAATCVRSTTSATQSTCRCATPACTSCSRLAAPSTLRRSWSRCTTRDTRWTRSDAAGGVEAPFDRYGASAASPSSASS